MTRSDYLARLGALLSGRLPEDEVDGILRYYEEYFREAGPGGEEALLEELGSPEDLAERILGRRVDRSEPFGESPAAPAPRRRRWLAAVLVVICALAAARFVLGRLPFYQGRQRAEAEGTFHTVDVDADLADVTVETGDRFRATADWKGRPGQLTAEVENGVLTVRSGGKADSVTDAEVRITVPSGTVLRAMNVSLSLGDITVLDQSCSGAVLLQTDLGDVTLEGASAAERLKAESALGDIDVSGHFPCLIEVHSDLGDVDLRLDLPADCYDRTAESDLGSVSINRATPQKTQEQQGFPATPYPLSATTDLGDVTLTFSE